MQRLIKPIVAIFALFGMQRALAQVICEKNNDGPGYSVCAADPAKADIRLFWKDSDGDTYGGFDRLAADVAGNGGKLAFAMNAGMFQPDFSPVGLYIENGQEVRPANMRAGAGNFALRPNGVFWIDGENAGVTETQKFLSQQMHPRFATQSGPMLVIGGKLHPKIRADGTSSKTRNGVGVCEDSKVRFVISDGPVTFFDFATYFRDRLKCPDALFLDGSISALFAPQLGRNDGLRGIGPIVGIVEKN